MELSVSKPLDATRLGCPGAGCSDRSPPPPAHKPRQTGALSRCPEGFSEPHSLLLSNACFHLDATCPSQTSHSQSRTDPEPCRTAAGGKGAVSAKLVGQVKPYCQSSECHPANPVALLSSFAPSQPLHKWLDTPSSPGGDLPFSSLPCCSTHTTFLQLELWQID